MIHQDPLQFERHGSSLATERRIIAALMVGFWLSFQLIFYFQMAFADDREVVTPGKLVFDLSHFIILAPQLVTTAFGCIICTGIYLLLRRVRRIAVWKQGLAALLAALAGAAGFAIAVSTIPALFGHPYEGSLFRVLILGTLRGFMPFGLWSGMTLVVTYNSELRERERRLAMVQAQAQDAQMRALRYQVNPHLLYNTLNSIAALILAQKNDLAEAMVLRLANFFRSRLATDPHSDVPLADEIALQKLYLDIEQMRFPNLATEFDIPDSLQQAPVPSLILQPLIENVLKHGINPSRLPTKLSVRVFEHNRKLVIEVSDNGPGTSSRSGTGTGLTNVRNRLSSRYGAKASLETESQAGRGFRVTMTIPVQASVV